MHFSFLPFWLMKSRLWLGALCFKHCLSSHSLFTSDTAHCSGGGGFLLCTALPLQLSWFVFILMFCYRMHSFHVLRSVMVWCKEKWDYISCFFKEVFKATKIHRGERSLQGGGCTLIREVHAYNTYGWRLLEIASTLKLIAIVVINSRTFFLKGCWDGLRLTKRCNEIKIQDNTKCSQCLLNNDGTLNITVCLQKCSKCGLFIVQRCLHFVFMSVQTFSPLAFLDLWKMLLTGRHGEMVTVPTVLRSALLLLE